MQKVLLSSWWRNKQQQQLQTEIHWYPFSPCLLSLSLSLLCSLVYIYYVLTPKSLSLTFFFYPFFLSLLSFRIRHETLIINNERHPLSNNCDIMSYLCQQQGWCIHSITPEISHEPTGTSNNQGQPARSTGFQIEKSETCSCKQITHTHAHAHTFRWIDSPKSLHCTQRKKKVRW